MFDVSIIGPSHTLDTHVLLPRTTPLAVHATVHDAPHPHLVPHLHLSDTPPHLGHHSSQLVTRNTWVVGPAHVIVANVNISVADATELHLEGDVIVPGSVPGDLNLGEAGVSSSLGPGHGGVHVSHDQ